jgi:hypothetical protein
MRTKIAILFIVHISILPSTFSQIKLKNNYDVKPYILDLQICDFTPVVIGKEILIGYLRLNGANLDVISIASGICFLKATNAKGMQVQKFVKE